MSDNLPKRTIRARLVIRGPEDEVRVFAAASGMAFDTLKRWSRKLPSRDGAHVWSIGTGEEQERPGRDAGRLLQEVLDRVEPGLLKWRDLGSPGAVRVWLQIVTYISECQGPALAFESELIKRIAATGLLFDIDVYCLGEERKLDAHE